MAKFNVGDKVKVLDGSNIKNYVGSWTNYTMRNLVGIIITITKVEEFGDRIGYKAKENSFIWDERGLELVEKKNDTMTETTAISSNNKKCSTVANYYVENFKKHNITYIRTVLEFVDGSKETVECRGANFDPYYGFVTCYAKHEEKYGVPADWNEGKAER